jgi:hypothetical protein
LDLVMADVLQFPKGASAGAVKPRAVDQPYEWAPGFEAALVHGVCASAEIYAKVGALLEPKALATKSATLAVTAAQALAADLGRGPMSTAAVAQRLARWRAEGKVTHEQLREVCELFDAAEDAGLLSPEVIILEAAAILKRRAEQRVVQQAMDVYAKRGDFSAVAKAAASASAIGKQEQTSGFSLDAGAFAEVRRLRARQTVPTGSLEFDAESGGGLPLGLTMFVAKEKAGKSMVLAALAAQEFLQGNNVALATLELDKQ